jgi:hypothetical protein
MQVVIVNRKEALIESVISNLPMEIILMNQYLRFAILCLFTSTFTCHSFANDWPMWRHDSGRTGTTQVSVPPNLELKWKRELPKLEAAFHSLRLQFDAGYEPVVADGRLLVASSRHDSVTAYDAATGRELWVYRTNGPVRFAPAVWKQSVCFGSDDGNMYCVDLSSGQLLWKHQVVPSNRMLLGNRRLISVWPVRGGPVVSDGKVYFAAGVWPFEGVFVCAMDIATGKLIWRNERLGHIFGQQPHETQAIGGLAPQGYLLVNDDELIVPCSTAYPARLRLADGELIEFELPAPGRLPGGWFAALDEKTSRDIRRGKVKFDSLINQQLHEDKVNSGIGDAGISQVIKGGDQTFRFEDKIDGVEGTIHSMIVANRQLFVSTREGEIYCFGEVTSQTEKQKTWKLQSAQLSAHEESIQHAKKIVNLSQSPYGIAVVVGLQDGSLAKALVLESKCQVIAIDDDPQRVENLRLDFQRANIPGERASVILADIEQLSIPHYLANLITSETPERVSSLRAELAQSLRPFGGIAVIGQQEFNEQQLKSSTSNQFEIEEIEGLQFIRRVGALPGTAEYQGNYEFCEDTLVRFPLGVLWFDDTLAHFKRSPQPQFKNGIMISRPKDWSGERVKGDYSVDYPLFGPVLSDMYTGRVLDVSEQLELRLSLPDWGRDAPQKSYYHAPHQKTALHPDPPIAGERINPLTGIVEPRIFPKTYGCDGGVDYGLFYTLRSGTAAFYDKSLESGTVFISGPRSGCTNSIIPSGGLLNVPYFYEGCTCSYPLPTALSLVAMPETHEQWASWGDDTVEANSIQRIGLNFGAPGDRKTRDGTLWLDYPSVGGPSPQLRIETIPANPKFHYRHSQWMKNVTVWPWVSASSVEGLQSLTLHDLKPGSYTVKLYFSEPFDIRPGERVQSIAINDKLFLEEFDVLEETDSSMTGIVKEISNVALDGVLTVSLEASQGQTLISGIELIRSE